jgi:hypothetical protein
MQFGAQLLTVDVRVKVGNAKGVVVHLDYLEWLRLALKRRALRTQTSDVRLSPWKQ